MLAGMLAGWRRTSYHRGPTAQAMVAAAVARRIEVLIGHHHKASDAFAHATAAAMPARLGEGDGWA